MNEVSVNHLVNEGSPSFFIPSETTKSFSKGQSLGKDFINCLVYLQYPVVVVIRPFQTTGISGISPPKCSLFNSRNMALILGRSSKSSTLPAKWKWWDHSGSNRGPTAWPMLYQLSYSPKEVGTARGIEPRLLVWKTRVPPLDDEQPTASSVAAYPSAAFAHISKIRNAF